MPKDIKVYERLDQACRLEKQWMNERLGWLFSSQSILFAAFGLALSAEPAERDDLTQLFLQAVPAIGFTTSVVVGGAIAAAIRAYVCWTRKLFSNTSS